MRIGMVALVLAMAACGGTDTGSGPASSGPSTPASTSAGETSSSPATTTGTAVATTTVDRVATSLVEPGPGEGASAVVVTGTSIRLLESDPVQVQLEVRAEFPTPCHEPSWDVEDDGSTISVALRAESDPGVVCTEVIEEVELSIDLGSFPVGSSRSVELNGEDVGDFEV